MKPLAGKHSQSVIIASLGLSGMVWKLPEKMSEEMEAPGSVK